MSTSIVIGGGGGGGAQGIQGVQGTQGVQGLDGAFVAQGIQGIQGTQGVQGQIGTQGATGIQGSVGNTGSQGIQGITGAQGATGTQGAVGTQGSTGATGAQGIQGVQGLEGSQGATGIGIQGIQGIQGTTGATGNTGSQGIQGIQGIEGLQGLTGSQGIQGIQGIQGLVGAGGATGLQGLQGIQGIQGIQGPQGLDGAFAAQGIQGPAGFGSQGYFATIYRLAGLTPPAPGPQIIVFSAGFINNNGFTQSSLFGANSGIVTNNFGWYRVYLQVQVYNSGATTESAIINIVNNFTTVTEASVIQYIGAGEYFLMQTECLVQITASNQEIRAVWNPSSTNLAIQTSAGFPVVLQIENVAGILQGVQGTQGLTGTQGAQGIQGIQGTIGSTGIQGVQGITGATGNTGIQGVQGTTGIQGATGIQGTQGIQGIQGIGNTGAQGIQGITGAQGIQGIQGLQGDPGVVGYYFSAYDTTNQTAGATGTEVIIAFASSYGSNSVSISAGNTFRINEAAVYKIQCEVQFQNSDAVNAANGTLYAKVNGTALIGTAVREHVPPLTGTSTTLEITQAFNAGDTIQFAFTVDDTDLSLRTNAASAPLPSGASAFANIVQVARTLGPLDGNIQLAYTTGYVNLTNGVDNTIAFNSSVFSYGAALTSSNLSTANAAVQFLYTGVYIVNVRAHFYDLGSNMTLSTTLYTSTNGTVWTFNTIIGLMRYEGTNTNQIQNSSFLVRVTSLPFYIQPRVQPSANAPFPADLGAPTAFSVTRVGDL
jgi:hypothetical protein